MLLVSRFFITLFIFVVASGMIFCLGSMAVAAPGDLDLTFSQDGKLYDFLRFGGDDVINATAIQSDGKIVGAGEAWFGGKRTCAVSRYNTDGSLDGTFDADGRTLFPTGQECVLSAVAIQVDGRIVAGGRIGNVDNDDFVVFRYNADGSPDFSFDGDGMARTSFGANNDEAHSLLLQPDGKIILAGIGSAIIQNDISLARYNTDGSLDTTFDSDGKVSTIMGDVGGYIWAAALQSDGKILVTGAAFNSVEVARYNPNGSLDTSFNSDGRVSVPIGDFSALGKAIAVQPDGKIVVAGSCTVVTGPGFPPQQNREFAVFRLNTDGSLDTSFDTDGKVIIHVSPYDDVGNALVIQPDGKILLGGGANDDRGFKDVALARINASGSVDATFNSTGVVITAISAVESLVNSVGLQPDGKIIAGGFNIQCCQSRANFSVLRYNSNGTLDTSFSSDGETNNDVGYVQSSGRAIAMLPNGKYFVAGTTLGADFEFALIKYNADGTPDPSFDGDGKISIDPLPGADEARTVAVQSDGKVVVAGSAGLPFNQPQSNDIALIRYNTDGSLDSTFDSDGKVITDIGVFDIANAVAIQPDGKLVVAASIAHLGMNTDITIIRYNTNGSLDTTFDSDGKATVAGSNSYFVSALAIQPDGKIVAAGQYYNGSNYDAVVVRFNVDGSPDTSFDVDGVVTTPILSGDDAAKAVNIQPDGKIVIAGFAYNGTNNDFAVVRYNPNGSLDTSFDSDGKLTTPVLSGIDEATSLAIQQNGKIIAAGTSSTVNTTNWLDHEASMVRFNANGSLDTTFSGDGKLAFDFWGASNDRLYGMTLDANGRALVVGEASSNFAIARVLGDALVQARPAFDFDGDGRADISVFRPSENKWYILRSSDGGVMQPVFALAGDIPTPADYDGDGKTDVAIFRPSVGDWWYLSSINNAQVNVHWGANGDIPRPSDFDGDGKSDFVVYRPSNSVWYRLGSAGTTSILAFGIAEDKPLVGDFDGDGKSDVAIFRPSVGDWWYAASSAGNQFRAVHWGANGDIPVPGDYDADGKTDFVVFRPSDGGWYILYSSGSYTIATFGLATDKPIAADYDGDGKTDIAVFRPSTGVWYLQQTTAGFGAIQWGIATDVPAPNAFVP